MKRPSLKLVGAGVAAGALAIGAVVALDGDKTAQAADHRDGPLALMDPAADITDVYAWMTSDATKLNLVMNVSPFAAGDAKFSDAVQYIFHLNSSAQPGMPATAVTIVCTFDVAQTIQCWWGDDGYVTGDASSTSGLTSADGKFKVFAGLRNDPFFFNLDGFKHVAATVEAAAPSLMFDTNGCPQLDAATSMLLVNMLKQNAMGTGPGTDTFADAEVLSIVVQVDKDQVTPGGPFVAVWASTNENQ